MAAGVGLGVNLADVLKTAEQADNLLGKMVDKSVEFAKNMKEAMYAQDAASIKAYKDTLWDIAGIAERLRYMRDIPFNIKVNKGGLDDVSESFVTIAELVEKITSAENYDGLFNPKELAITERSFLVVKNDLDEILNKSKRVKSEWESLTDKGIEKTLTKGQKEERIELLRLLGVWDTLDDAERKRYDKGRKMSSDRAKEIMQETETIRTAYREVIEIEADALREREATLRKELSASKKTVEQKRQITETAHNKELKDAERQVAELEKTYSGLIAKRDKLQKSIEGIDSAKDSTGANLTSEQQKTYDALIDEYIKVDDEIKKLYIKHQAELSNITKESILDRAGMIEKELKERDYAKDEAIAIAKNAKTINEMKVAQSILVSTRDKTDKGKIDDIRELNQEYINLRLALEDLQSAEHNEKRMAPSILGEYERLLKSIDDIKNKIKEFEEAKKKINILSGDDIDIAEQITVMKDRLDDLKKKKKEIETGATDQLTEIHRKYEAEKTRISLEEYKRRADKLEKTEEKYGKVSSLFAQDVIDNADAVENIQQERAAVEELKKTREKLDKTEAGYADTVNSLNDAIKKHEENIRAVADAERYQREQEEKSNKERNNALAYSRQANTITKLKKAIEYLTAARAEEDLSTDEGREHYVELTEELKRQKEAYEELTEESSKLSKLTVNLSATVKGAFSVSAIKGYVDQVVSVRGEFELQQRALQAIVQDIDKANQLWDKTVSLAIKSPFRVKELVTYTKQLAAYRIETDKLYETNKMLADISAGLGVDMDRLILAYGQVKTANYLRGTELRQFSEAGVNVLGELANYFSELEGHAVSVGEVFERVSKRMVSFEDVSAVLHRLTEEGGIFYRMQEVQAETVQGQIANIKDSIDVMLNDIGKSNEGIIKGVLGVTRVVIENWEKVRNVLLPSVMAFTALRLASNKTRRALLKFALTQGYISTTSLTLGQTLKLLNLRFKMLWGTISKGIKNVNPWILAITALIGAIISVIAWGKRLDRAKEATAARLDREADKVRKLKREYMLLQAEEKKEGAEADAVLENKKKKLAELIELAKRSGLKIDIDIESIKPEDVDAKVKEVSSEIDVANNLGEAFAMSLTKVLNAAQGNIAGWHIFGDNFATDIEQANEKMNAITNETNIAKFQDLLVSLGGAYDSLSDEAKRAFDSLKMGRKENESDYNYYYRVAGALATVREELNKTDGVTNMQKKKLKQYADEIWGYVRSLREVKNEARKVAAKALDEYGSDEFYSAYNKDKEGFSYLVSFQMNKKLNDEGFNEEHKRLALKAAESVLSIPLVFIPKEDLGTNELSDWQKKYNAFVDKINASLPEKERFSLIEDPETTREKAAESIKAVTASYDTINEQKKNGAKGLSDVEVAQARRVASAAAKLTDWLVGTKTKSEGRDPVLDKLKQRIALIKEMNSEYEKLRKKYTAEQAASKVRSSFAQTARDLGLDISKMAFTDKGAVDALIEERAQYSAEKYITEVDKAIDNRSIEIGIEFRAQKLDELKSEINSLFDNLSLSNELKSLGISKDLASTFGIEFINEDNLRRQILTVKDDFYRLGTDGEKAYQEMLKKLNDMEEKAAVERMKTYSKYLLQGTSERVKLKVEEMKKLKEIEESKEFTPEQKKQISAGVREESNKALQKQEWEDFKNSEMYSMMFDDIEHYGTKSLKALRDRLDQLKGSLNNLDPANLKEIMTQIKKLDEQINKRNPINSLIASIRGVQGLEREGDLELQLVNSDAEIARIQTIIDTYDLWKKAQETGTMGQLSAQDLAAINALKLEAIETKQTFDKLVEGYRQTKKNLEDASAAASDDVDKWKDFKQAMDSAGDALISFGNAASASFDYIKELSESFGADTEGPGWLNAHTAITMVSSTMEGFGKAAKGFATGNPLDIISGCAEGIAAVVKGLNELADNGREEVILREAEKVERLTKEYKKLENTIDNITNTDAFKTTFDSINNNLERQKAAYERMIQQGKAKKNMDKDDIKEWESALDEIESKIQDRMGQMYEELGGFNPNTFASAAQSFVDSWLSAFKDTGDGLTALGDSWDEYFDKIVAKQLMLKVTDQFLSNNMKEINALIADTAVSPEDFKKKIAEIKARMPELNDLLEALVAEFGYTAGMNNGGQLSNLQKGIQGITEPTAQALEALLNSMRFFVADSNVQLKEQTKYVRNLYNMLDGMRAAHTSGGTGIKVVI